MEEQVVPHGFASSFPARRQTSAHCQRCRGKCSTAGEKNDCVCVPDLWPWGLARKHGLRVIAGALDAGRRR